MEIKMKKIKTNSPKKKSNKSIDKYKEFLGDKKDVIKSKDKKVFSLIIIFIHKPVIFKYFFY